MEQFKLGDIIVVKQNTDLSESCMLRKVRMVIGEIDRYGNITGIWEDDSGIVYRAYSSARHFVKEN